MFPERVVERVMSKWLPEGECWVSTYSTGSHGYAQIGWWTDGKRFVTVAHRVAWWSVVRTSIPSGMTVDHRCHNRRCVNPDHLRLLTNSANASDNGMFETRSNQPTGTLCQEGHQMIRSSTGPTYCRDCNAARKRRYRSQAA